MLSSFTKIFLLLILLIHVLSGQNLILNPGFENGTTTNWTEIGSATSITQSSAQLHSGSYSCRFADPTSNYTGRGIQSVFISVTANTYYDLSGWFYVANDGAGSVTDTDIRIRIFWFQSDQTTACSPASNPSTTGWSVDVFNTWYKKELNDLQAPSNAAYAYVLMECQEDVNNDNDVFIDDVSLLPSVTISGASGFRIMSSPVSGTIYSDLLSELWIQGMTDGDVTSGNANVWTYSGSAWSALSNLSTASLTAGQGFLVYVFANTDNSGTDDLPVTLSVSGTENVATITTTTTYSSDGGGGGSGWNLLGNPFISTIDFDNMSIGGSDGINDNFSSTVYVWDNATTAYKSYNGTGTLTNGFIAPFQGFWIQSANSSGTSFQFTESAKTSANGTFYKITNDSSGSIAFTVTSASYSDHTFVSFMTNGETGYDNADAWKLLPLTPTERIVGLSYIDNQGLDINNLPYQHETDITIPIDVMKLTVDSNYYFNTSIEQATLAWDLTNLPESVAGLTLTNIITNESTDLLQTDNITFTTQEKGSFPAYGSNGVNVYPQMGNSQFTLTITYRTLNTDEALLYPKQYALHTPYPNPFNPDVSITFDVPKNNVESMRASSLQTMINIYNINGQRVETLSNNPQPGRYTITWNPKNLSSGIYILQLNSPGKVINKKITYIK